MATESRSPTPERTDRPERAVAVLVRGGRLLVVTRCRGGERYAVLPGGGIEPGEKPAQAVVRELAEETGLRTTGVRPLWVRDDGGRRAHYLVVDDPGGEPVLGGPERERQRPDNRYGFAWLGPDALGQAGLQPSALVPLLTAHLTGPDQPVAPG